MWRGLGDVLLSWENEAFLAIKEFGPKFDIVYPAGGSLNTSVEVPTERLFALVAERWVDLCRLPEEAPGT